MPPQRAGFCRLEFPRRVGKKPVAMAMGGLSLFKDK
jgi:hypothetical protein